KLEGTYLMFPNLSSYGKTSDEMTDYLLKEGKIAVSSGSHFGSNGEGHVRMCIATSESIINEALDRMERALAKLR
ncbi:pyridoxal phosphate-dependent aminotransferase, partial [Candidatus Bathyarchaeota archaeon]